MSSTSYDKAFEIVVGLEGGYVNDPRDPGGETKYGISKRAYPDLDIASLTLDQAKQIYRRDYWELCNCGAMPFYLAVSVFDCAVNQGVETAKKMLQKSLGVKEDGVIGPQTLAAMQKASAIDVCSMFMSERALRYVKTKNFDIYGRGWFKRLFHIAFLRE